MKMCDFQTWLNSRLKQLKIDESVFGSYIVSILEEEDDKFSALEGLFSELMEKDAEKYINEILDKWNSYHPSSKPAIEDNKKENVDIDVQLAKILETKIITSTSHQRQYTAEEKKIKEAILAQYSQCSDKEEDEEDLAGADYDDDPNLVKNTNKADVLQLQKDKREQARLDSKLKKEKDRGDREKQKQLREEKKEKRKTVKQERKR